MPAWNILRQAVGIEYKRRDVERAQKRQGQMRHFVICKRQSWKLEVEKDEWTKKSVKRVESCVKQAGAKYST